MFFYVDNLTNLGEVVIKTRKTSLILPKLWDTFLLVFVAILIFIFE
jgi:hypothetical protein